LNIRSKCRPDRPTAKRHIGNAQRVFDMGLEQADRLTDRGRQAVIVVPPARATGTFWLASSVAHEGMLEPAGDFGHHIAAKPFFDQPQHQVEDGARARYRDAPAVAQDRHLATPATSGKLGLERGLIAPVNRTGPPLHQPGPRQREDAARKGAQVTPVRSSQRSFGPGCGADRQTWRSGGDRR
jgi:hypothetical protein